MAAPGGIEPRAFWAFELAGWEHAAEPYQRHWGSLTRQAIPSLLETIGAGAGVRLLDVACGPGWVSAAAAERGARPLGIDFSPNMVQRARQFAPGLDFVVGDAEELALRAGSVDAVAVNFGLLHLGRPERAVEEAFRVLRPGGRVGFTVWAPPEEAVVFGIVLRAVSGYGDPKVPLPGGPPFFRFSDPEEAKSLLVRAGFVDPVAVQRIDQVWRVPSVADVFEAMHQGTARTGGLLRRQTPQQLEAIRAAVLAELNSYTVGGTVELPMPAVLASATRP